MHNKPGFVSVTRYFELFAITQLQTSLCYFDESNSFVSLTLYNQDRKIIIKQNSKLDVQY